MPIFCQLVALTAVALVGAIDIGTLLAAALGFTFIHICKETRRWSRQGKPSQSMHEAQAPSLQGALSQQNVSFRQLWGVTDNQMTPQKGLGQGKG